MNRRPTGFTLIEVLMAMSITAMIGVALTSLALTASSGWAAGDESADASSALHRGTAYVENRVEAAADARAVLLLWHDAPRESARRDYEVQFHELQAVVYDPDADAVVTAIPLHWDSLTAAQRAEAAIPAGALAESRPDNVADFLMNAEWTRRVEVAGPTRPQVTFADFVVARDEMGRPSIMWSFRGRDTLGERTSTGFAAPQLHLQDNHRLVMKADAAAEELDIAADADQAFGGMQ